MRKINMPNVVKCTYAFSSTKVLVQLESIRKDNAFSNIEKSVQDNVVGLYGTLKRIKAEAQDHSLSVRIISKTSVDHFVFLFFQALIPNIASGAGHEREPGPHAFYSRRRAAGNQGWETPGCHSHFNSEGV
jgi:hypothetical protein